jgi:hypothetical protein
MIIDHLNSYIINLLTTHEPIHGSISAFALAGTPTPIQLHHNGNLSPIRPREKMPTVYRHRQSPSREHLKKEGVQWPKDNSYLRKRLNNDIELERSTMIMKTG